MNINKILNPITVQNHKNNQFNTDGEKVTVLNTFRSRYGYPNEGETRFFLAVSDRHTPVIIVQKYDQPVENRPADEVNVYELPQSIVENPNITILRQFTSDLLFETNCANLDGDEKILLQTWIHFINIAKYNSKINFSECIYKLGSTSAEDIHPICNSLSEKEIARAFYIMNSLRNTTNDRIKAIEIASLNFDDQVKFNSAELIAALQSLPECGFKTKGFLYLAKLYNTDVVTRYIMNNPNIQQSIFYDYINLVQQHNVKDSQRCRLNLNPYEILNIKVSEEKINQIIPDTIDLPFDLMIEMLIICLIFYSNDICYNYINAIKKEVKINQTFRHSLMLHIHETKQKNDILLFLLNERKMSNLHSLFTLNSSNEYIHDAYFLGLILYQHYKKISSDFDENCAILSELAIESYKKEDDYLYYFTKTASRKIKKYVLSNLKLATVSSVNSEIKDCLKNLFSLYKKKFEVIRNIRKMRK